MVKEVIINKEIKWIDILAPTAEDLKFLGENFNFHPIVMEELLQPSARSKVENYDDYVFIVAHLPNYDSGMRSARQAEIDLLITKDALITIHYDKLEPLGELNSYLSDERSKTYFKDTGKLLCFLLNEISKFSLRQLHHIEEKVNKISEELFLDKERKLLEEISFVKRDIAAFGIIVCPQRHILESLVGGGVDFWGKRMKTYFTDTLGEHLRIVHSLSNLKETLNALEETNSQLLNFKTNEVMKILTVLAFLTFPATLIVSILQIDRIGEFFSEKPLLAALPVVAVIFICIILVIFFKKKKWL